MQMGIINCTPCPRSGCSARSDQHLYFIRDSALAPVLLLKNKLNFRSVETSAADITSAQKKSPREFQGQTNGGLFGT